MRRTSRELAFKFIYETIFSRMIEEIDFSLREDEYADLEKEEFEYAVLLYKKFFENQTNVIAKIEKSVQGYSLDRMFKIDLALLALAITEHDFFNQPLAIVTNEILELAKLYSTEKSVKFLNGVISTIYGEKNVWKSNKCDKV